jgi:hypothetical protein
MGRALALAAIFAVAAVLMVAVNAPHTELAPRVPADSGMFAVDGWQVGEGGVDGRTSVTYLSRDFVRASDGARASLVITSSPQSKLVYRAGADVPLLGNGYSVEPLDSAPDRSVLVARRGNEAWLQIAAFGERRGTFGNGAVAWSLAVVDAVLGRNNDYYLARVLVPYSDSSVESGAAAATQLADALFPRIAAYYAG